MQNMFSKRTLKNHWHYCWWKYLVMAIVCALGVDMVFAMTRYVPPANKKIELYLCSGYADAAALQEDLWPAFQAAAPDQEQLSVVNINLLNDDMYANMQFTTYIGAQQGDVLLLPKAYVMTLAAEGGDTAYYELTPFIESGLMTVDADLSAGIMPSEAGEPGLYAIPADTLYGLMAYGCDPADSMLCIMGFSLNPDNAARVIDLMFERYQTEKPENYDEMRRAKQEQQAQATQLYR